MRIRIALATALAVCITSTVIIGALTDLSTAQAATTAPSSHRTAAAHHSDAHLRQGVRSSKTWRVRSVPDPRTQVAPFGFEESALTQALVEISEEPAPAPAVVAPPPPPVPVTDATSTDTADWACIRTHESGDRYNSESAPSGAYGIVQVTWHSFGHSGWPFEAPAATQDALALHLYHLYGWQPWSTRFVCGL
jgi:hypothetical protein